MLGRELVSPQSEPALAAANERVVAAPAAETDPSAATGAKAVQLVDPLGLELPPLENPSTSVAGATPETRTDEYFGAKYAGFTRADYEATFLALEAADRQNAVEVQGKNVAPTDLQREIAWLKERAYP